MATNSQVLVSDRPNESAQIKIRKDVIKSRDHRTPQTLAKFEEQLKSQQLNLNQHYEQSS